MTAAWFNWLLLDFKKAFYKVRKYFWALQYMTKIRKLVGFKEKAVTWIVFMLQ